MVIMHENVINHFRLFQAFQGIERSHCKAQNKFNCSLQCSDMSVKFKAENKLCGTREAEGTIFS